MSLIFFIVFCRYCENGLIGQIIDVSAANTLNQHKVVNRD